MAEAITHAAWLAAAQERFGEDPAAWRFQCPFCLNVASVQDWIDTGLSKREAAERAPVECIGRRIGARGGMREDGEHDADGNPAKPCDWAAFGLFGNLGRGPTVMMEGKAISAFAFEGEVPNVDV